MPLDCLSLPPSLLSSALSVSRFSISHAIAERGLTDTICLNHLFIFHFRQLCVCVCVQHTYLPIALISLACFFRADS